MKPSLTFIIVSSIIFFSCSTSPLKDYPKHSSELLANFYKRKFADTANLLEKGSNSPGPDRILFLLDRAMALHNEKKYVESNKLLYEVDRIVSIDNYSKKTSIRANNTENLTRKFYRSDEYEYVLLSFYQALNFMMMELHKEALQELRKAEDKLREMQLIGGRQYTLPPIFSVLSGIIYEKLNLWPSAFSEYKRIFSGTQNSPVSNPLLRVSMHANQADFLEWTKQKIPDEQAWLKQKYQMINQGEIIVVLQNGIFPKKEPNPEHPELSIIPDDFLSYTSSHIYIDGEKNNSGEIFFDIVKLSQENLQEKKQQFFSDISSGDITGELKRQRLATIRKKNNPFDASARTVKLVADLRQWESLPSNIQILRTSVYPGVHRVMIQMENDHKQKSSLRDLGDVIIEKPGEIKILTYREF